MSKKHQLSEEEETSTDYGSVTFSDDMEPTAEQLQEKYLAPTDDSEFEDDFETGLNTIGASVPQEWYCDYPHIGYTQDGKKVLKPVTSADQLDNFLTAQDDPLTFRDTEWHKDSKLSMEELEMIERLGKGLFPDTEMNPYEDFQDIFTQDVMDTPLSGAPEPKRRFIPSKWEHKTIMKLVRAIRKGDLVVKSSQKSDQEVLPDRDLWSSDAQPLHHTHVSAPKMKLPTHAESYNPPAEYLFDEQELKEFNETDKEDRRQNFVPKKHDNLRSVGAYPEFVQERFSRCLDLYLCPRAVRKRVLDPDSMLPELPNPKDLEPYPKQCAIQYKGHAGNVRSISLDPSGQWMVSGGDDKTLRLWEVASGWCKQVWHFEEAVVAVQWNPNPVVSLVAIASGKRLIVVNPGVADEEVMKGTDVLMKQLEAPEGNSLSWSNSGEQIVIQHKDLVTQVNWHKKGDYFTSLTKANSMANSIYIHQLSKNATQQPFKSSTKTELVQSVKFHPSKPFLFVATQRHIRIYNLVRQELHRKLQPGAKWISSMDVHHQGDNLIVGTYDCKLCWFDMDLAVTPYKNMRPHEEKAIRSVSYHKRHPLFASAGDDGKIQIFHGKVFNDLLLNPLIVPIRKLQHQNPTADGIGALSCTFHPFQPWVFTSGSDGVIKCFS